MTGILVELPTYVFDDNKFVLSNTSVPHFVLNKKLLSITYHSVNERVATDAWGTAYLHTGLNPADMGTKSLAGGIKQMCFTFYTSNILLIA